MTCHQQNSPVSTNDHRALLSGSRQSLYRNLVSPGHWQSAHKNLSVSTKPTELCATELCRRAVGSLHRILDSLRECLTAHQQDIFSLSNDHRALLSGSQHAHPSVSAKTTELCRQAVCSLQQEIKLKLPSLEIA